MTTPDEPPPVVSHRLNVHSLDDWLDRLMARIPRTTVSFKTDDERAAFRRWLANEVSILLRSLELDLLKGAQRGIQQILDLAVDPAYYQTLQRRRAVRQERAARERAEQKRLYALRKMVNSIFEPPPAEGDAP